MKLRTDWEPEHAAEEQADNGAKAKLPAMKDASALLKNLPPTPPELIDGILHQGSKLVLAGASKSNKSWLLFDMAISVATGAAWWGIPTRKGRVLYLNFEIQEAFAARRIKRIAEAKGVKLKDGELMLWNLRGHCTNLALLKPEIVARMRGEGFVLGIIDPIYKLSAGRDDNSVGEVGLLLNDVEQIAVETDAAMAFGAHFSKGNQSAKESIDRIGGSGVYARDPDSILTLTRHEEEGAFTVEPILRNHPPCDPFVMRWEFPLMRRDADLDPADLKKAKNGSDPTFHPETLLALLKEKGGRKGLTGGEWETIATSGKKAMSESTYNRLRRRLSADGKVERNEFTHRWKPT